MIERYCGPKSGPWELRGVGSWACQNSSSSLSNGMTLASYSIWITSACPVRPVEACSYVGLTTFPPEYPETTDLTPGNRSNTASVHQKQPPPNVAVSIFGL